MLSVENHDQLRQHIAKTHGVAITPLLHREMPIEQHRVLDRYQTVSFALWLLFDPETRIREVWKAKVVRFNLLLRDFKDAPKWFTDLAGRLNRVQFPELYMRTALAHGNLGKSE
jgi:hypothetical protein